MNKNIIWLAMIVIVIISMNSYYQGKIQEAKDSCVYKECVCPNVCNVDKVLSECELDCVLEKRHHIKIIDKQTKSGEIKWKKIN